MNPVVRPGGSGTHARVLFVPVSGPSGMGEYARCRTIADGLRRRHPGVETPFVISRHAPYAGDVPEPVHRFPDTPTRETERMIALIDDLAPDAIVFDNAGRTRQLCAARDRGARVVFISSRPKKRWKAFRPRWMDNLDAHWIAYPEFLAGSLTAWERYKLRRHPRVRVTFLGTVFPEPDAAAGARCLADLDVREDGYVLVAPGGGGTHRGAPNAIAAFREAAGRIAAEAEVPVVLVLGPAFRGDLPAIDGVRALRAVPGPDMAALVGGARVAVLNGGSTMTQALALGCACVVAPIADDQRDRIRRCERLGLVRPAALGGAELAGGALALLADDRDRDGLIRRVHDSGVSNGLHLAVAELGRLLALGGDGDGAGRP